MTVALEIPVECVTLPLNTTFLECYICLQPILSKGFVCTRRHIEVVEGEMIYVGYSKFMCHQPVLIRKHLYTHVASGLFAMLPFTRSTTWIWLCTWYQGLSEWGVTMAESSQSKYCIFGSFLYLSGLSDVTSVTKALLMSHTSTFWPKPRYYWEQEAKESGQLCETTTKSYTFSTHKLRQRKLYFSIFIDFQCILRFTQLWCHQ